MYSLMIVDDQKKAIDSMIKSFNWEEMNIRISQSAKNGIEALELMKKDVPDIAIIDIEMPSMNGIDLIAEMRALGYASKIIVLTAYTDFKYAQALIPYDVTAYLLKSAHTHEIKDAILDAVRKLDNKKSQVLSEDKINTILTQNLAILRERFLETLLHNSSMEPDETEKNIEFFGFDIKNKPLRVITAEILSSEKIDTLSLQKIQLQIINDMLNQLEIKNTYTNFINHCGIFITDITHADRLLPVFTDLMREWNNLHNVKVYLGISSELSDYTLLSQGYQEALECLNYKNGWPDFLPIFFDDIIYTQICAPVNNIYDREALIKGIKSRNIELITKCVDAFRLNLTEYRYASVELAKSLCIELITTSISTSLRIGEAVPPPDSGKHSYIDMLSSANDIDTMLDIISDFFIVLLDHINDKNTSRRKQVVNQMLDYVAGNYMEEDISITSLSRRFYISRNYLSAAFTMEMNTSFREYLTRFRLEKAHELIKENKYTVTAVANMVGYKKVDYFRHLYQKYYKKNPSEML